MLEETRLELLEQELQRWELDTRLPLADSMERGWLSECFVESPQHFLLVLGDCVLGCGLTSALIGRMGMAPAVEFYTNTQVARLYPEPTLILAAGLHITPEQADAISRLHVNDRQIVDLIDMLRVV